MTASAARSAIASLLGCCLFVLSHQALATTFTCTWSGLGADNNWQTDGNWDVLCNGAAPHVPHANDDLVFPSGAARLTNTNNIPAGTAFKSITFTGGGYTITGNQIALSTAGISVNSVSNIQNTLNTDLAIAGATTISMTGGSGHVLGLGGVISGGGSLAMNGNNGGQFNLSGNNTYTGGTSLAALFLQVGNNNAFGTGMVTVNSASTATINPAGFTIPNAASFGGNGQGNNGVVNGDGTWNGPITLTAFTEIGGNGVLTFNGIISGGFALSVGESSSSAVTFGANNTYNGTTTVFAGTLFVNGLQPSSNVVVNNTAAAILGGTGTVGAVSLTGPAAGGSAHLAPGLSPGIINTGNLAMPAGTNFDVQLNGLTAGSGYDQANVTGTVSLGGTLNVTLGFSPPNGAAFTIINNDVSDSVSGTFAGLAQGATFVVNGVTFQISYTGGTGNDVVLTVQSGGSIPSVPTPIPTLQWWALWLLGLLILLVTPWVTLRQRKRN
jgi:fibronectin-binding autotransporter adhesin